MPKRRSNCKGFRDPRRRAQLIKRLDKKKLPDRSGSSGKHFSRSKKNRLQSDEK